MFLKKVIGLLCFSMAYIQGMSQTYCASQTQAYCCGYGITSVTFAGISQSSQDGAAGYENYTAWVGQASEGSSIPISIQTGGIEPHDVRIWLDANTDGSFEHPGEMVYEALGVISPQGTLSLPANTGLDVPLRLRITADFAGNNPLPCVGPAFGQTEDYSLQITSSGEMPVADFTASATVTCNGVVHFQSLSTGNPSVYQWNFGDGGTSSEEAPYHTYVVNGLYDVTLTVANSRGADTLVKTDYIHVSLSEACDTFLVPEHGTASILHNCNYVLMDNGKSGNYSDNTNGILALSPVWAQKVCISFSEFHFEPQFDYIEIYDGPSPASAVIGKYTGTALPPSICSSGPALCIRQVSDDIVTYSGFTAQVLCTLGIDEEDVFAPTVFPNPFQEQVTISFPQDLTAMEVTLFSLEGKQVFSKIYNSNTAIVSPLEQMANGVYMLRVGNGKTVWLRKIVKM